MQASFKTRAFSGLVTAILISAGIAPAAFAGVPDNDDFANATMLSGPLPLTVEGTNVQATAEPGEPLHDDSLAAASVWYGWTPPESMRVVIDACVATFNPGLGVYTGAGVDALAPVGVGIDPPPDCSGFDPVTRLDAVAGTTYWIAIDGFVGDEGDFTLRIRLPNPPPNDVFASAQVLDAPLPIAVEGTNLDATKEVGEPSLLQNDGGSSVWYRWTASVTGSIMVDPCDDNLYTLVAVYTGGSLDSLAQVAGTMNFGECDALPFTALAGTVYWILIDGVLLESGIDQGTFILQLREPQRPANDDFDDAIVLAGERPITITATNVDASKEPGEPNHAGATGGASVWFRWTADVTGLVSIDTCESDFDTLLAVYTGATVDALTEVASSDDHGFCQIWSFVRFEATAGTTYHIAVDGYFQTIPGGTGQIGLEIAGSPPNDDFDAGQPVEGAKLPLSATGTTFNATKEAGEPNHGGNRGGNSIWFTWTAARSQPIVVDTCGSGVQHVVAVYTGSTVGALTELASSDDGCGDVPVGFDAVAGTTYRIAVDGFGGSGGTNFGSVVLNISHKNWKPSPVPTNDDFASAALLDAQLPIVVSGANNGASKEAGEPNHAGNAGGSSVWYRWTAPFSGPMTIDTCGSSFDTLLAVYTGGTLGSLAPVAANDDACGLRSRVVIGAVAGTTYHIAVDAYGGVNTGEIVLAIAPKCDEMVSGSVGAVEVTVGQTCLVGAKVDGSVTVGTGARLWSSETTIRGSVVATGAAAFTACGTRIVGEVSIAGAAAVVFGNPDQACGANRVDGSVVLVETAGPSILGGNTIKGDLTCIGNVPPPVNAGSPNDVLGQATGQCVDL